jgi:predicted GNAT family acetyltransferase
MPGYTEISAVCTHPDHRGKQLAHHLVLAVAGRIRARGDNPMLHAFANNAPAIALYEKLGFHVRTTLHVTLLRLAVAPSARAGE